MTAVARRTSRPEWVRRLRLPRFSKMLLFVIATIGLVLMSWPTVWTVLTSFKTPDEVMRIPMTWLPDRWFYFQNYVELFTVSRMLRWLMNSAITVLISLITSLFTSSLAGYAFARLRFRGREVLFMSVIAMIMMPGEVTIIPLYLMFNEAGLVNTYPGLIGPNFMSVFGVFIMRQFMETVPSDYIDSARLDGAGEFSTFLQIALPITKPALVTLAVIKAIGVWNGFLWPYVMAATDDMYTAIIGLQLAVGGQFYTPYTLTCTASVVTMLPMFILFIVLQRRVMDAMVLSGLKG